MNPLKVCIYSRLRSVLATFLVTAALAGCARAEVPTPAAATSGEVDVTWLSWEAAQAAASESGQPMMVLFYADWCPRCQELDGFMQTPSFARAADGLLLVRHNSDEEARWADENFGMHGAYVPRIFFVDATGQMHPELVSNHPRFPFFYSASQSAVLTHRMGEAVDRLTLEPPSR